MHAELIRAMPQIIGGLIGIFGVFIGITIQRFIRAVGKITLYSPIVKIVPQETDIRVITIDACLFNSSDTPCALIDIRIVFYQGRKVLGEFGLFNVRRIDIPSRQIVVLSGSPTFPSSQEYYGQNNPYDMSSTLSSTTRVFIEGKIVGRWRTKFKKLLTKDFQKMLNEGREELKNEMLLLEQERKERIAKSEARNNEPVKEIEF